VGLSGDLAPLALADGSQAGDMRRGPYRRRNVTNAVERGEHNLAAFQAGCRCLVCCRARRTYDRTWRAALSLSRRGEARWKVPIGPASRHIWQLRRAGLSTNTIAASAGLPMPTVEGIAAGRRARCWNTTRDAILAVEP
jgi:hypothetical protein